MKKDIHFWHPDWSNHTIILKMQVMQWSKKVNCTNLCVHLSVWAHWSATPILWIIKHAMNNSILHLCWRFSALSRYYNPTRLPLIAEIKFCTHVSLCMCVCVFVSTLPVVALVSGLPHPLSTVITLTRAIFVADSQTRTKLAEVRPLTFTEKRLQGFI